MEILSYLLGKKASGGGGGSGKFTIEEGTWTPTENTNRGEISFPKRHSKTPMFVSIVDVGTNIDSDAIVYFEYSDFYQLHGETMTNKNGLNFRYECNASWLYAATTTINGGATVIRHGPNTIIENYTKEYARYYVDEQKFYPTMNSSSRYWLAGRPYKWIAIWTDE